METEKIKILLESIARGGISGAAEGLGYTPSGVSRAIAALEAETGFPLLVRNHSGVFPTKECQTLLPIMNNLVHEAERYKQVADEICGLEKGHITVGTAYHTYYRRLAHAIADFTASYPGIIVDIAEGTSSELSGRLERREADFCIISRRSGNFRWIPLCEDQLVVWVHQNHPCVTLDKYPLQQLKTDPFIQLYPRRETDNSLFFSENGIQPNTRFNTYDVYAAYAMVEAGLGVTLTNELHAHGWGGNVKILPIDPPQVVSIGIAAREEEKMAPAARRFLAFAEPYFA